MPAWGGSPCLDSVQSRSIQCQALRAPCPWPGRDICRSTSLLALLEERLGERREGRGQGRSQGGVETRTGAGKQERDRSISKSLGSHSAQKARPQGAHSQVPGVILCLHVTPSVHPHTSPTKRDSILVSYSQLFRHG